MLGNDLAEHEKGLEGTAVLGNALAEHEKNTDRNPVLGNTVPEHGTEKCLRFYRRPFGERREPGTS